MELLCNIVNISYMSLRILYEDFLRLFLSHNWVILECFVSHCEASTVLWPPDPTCMRDSGRPVAWDRLSLRLIPGYGSVSNVTRRSSTCSLEKLVLFLRLAPLDAPPPGQICRGASAGEEELSASLTDTDSRSIQLLNITCHEFHYLSSPLQHSDKSPRVITKRTRCWNSTAAISFSSLPFKPG